MTSRLLRVLRSTGIALVALIIAASSATAAETVHLYLKANGSDVSGDSTQSSLGRANSIECVQFDQTIQMPANAGGKAQYGPITCVKRIDRSTPLLIKAVIKGEAVSGTFKFFRPNPTGDGTTQQFYTIDFARARITGYRMYVPDTITPNTSSMPPLEEITFTYRSATWTYNDTGVSFSTTMDEEENRKADERLGYDLKAEVGENGQVFLKWSVPETEARISGYDVYRSTDSTAVVTERNRILDVPIEKTATYDRVFAGTYYYVVQAILRDGTRLDPSPAVVVIVE